MSDTLGDTFNEFVNKLNTRLDDIDQNYPDDGKSNNDCEKYLKKLDVYKHFTDGLIQNGNQFLDIIDHMKMELARSVDADVASTTSNASTIDNEQALNDLKFIGQCLSKRTELEERAMSSLSDLEGIVDALLTDKMKLLDENRHLKARAKKPTSNDDKIVAPDAKNVKRENDKPNDFSSQNADAKQMAPKKSSESARDEDNKCADLYKKIDDLQQELSKKEEQIKDLSEILRKISSKSPLPTESNESTKGSKRGPLKHTRSQSDGSRSMDRDSPSNLTDCENKDDDKFENAFKELTAILKEKYQQLREYRAKLAEMKKQLEKCEAHEQNLIKLNEVIETLKGENTVLANELLATRTQVGTLQELQKQTEVCNKQLENLKEYKHILARKYNEQETHIEKLMNERTKLIDMNNELLASIAVCKNELGKYNTNKTA